MSAEVTVAGFFSKPLVWLLGLAKGLIIYVWFRHTKDVDAIKKDLKENYYNKETTDLKINPVKDAIDKNTEATEKLHESVNKLAVQVAKYK